MPRLPLALLACLALAGGGLIAGCGDDKSDSASSPPAAAPPPVAPAETAPAETTPAGGEAVEVGIKNIKFAPEKITAKVGQKIVWTNNEAVPHNVTARDGADFKSEILNEGDTFEYTPTKAGEIAYVCTIHSGQSGSITVTQ